jgi:hypothetical protein
MAGRFSNGRSVRAFPALARHGESKAVTSARLPAFGRCHVLWQFPTAYARRPSYLVGYADEPRSGVALRLVLLTLSDQRWRIQTNPIKIIASPIRRSVFEILFGEVAWAGLRFRAEGPAVAIKNDNPGPKEGCRRHGCSPSRYGARAVGHQNF